MTVPITQSIVPDWEEFRRTLAGTWETGHFTNHGPLVDRLELLLAVYTASRHVVCVSSGTFAIWAAVKALWVEAGDEVIVPAFTYPATAAAVALAGARPVLADVDPETLLLTEASVEEAVTDRTAAVVPVHTYGNPVDLDAWSARTGIPVVYDAAHAFGQKLGRGVQCYSFHATKVMHTGEGGAIATDDADLADRVRRLRNFGHAGETSFEGFGVNGKMNELQAAMGLCVLPMVPDAMLRRSVIAKCYDSVFMTLGGVAPRPLPRKEGFAAYYPVLFTSVASCLLAMGRLEARGFRPRRYFYPSLRALPWCCSRNPTPVADDAARRVLCLPLSHLMEPSQAFEVANLAAGLEVA